jgi:anaerobic nitric oxide reductase transcription regulator
VLVLQNVSDERAHTPAFASEYITFTQDFASLLSPFVDRAVLIAQTGDAATLGIVGAGRAMVDVRTHVRGHAMHSDLPVLVVGPQGSGRTHVARAVHANSPRRARPLLHEHCGAWSSDEASDLLFGVDGPHPQAGLLAAVDGGTLLLEEIDTLPGSTQAALVRFLDTGAYRPRGATQDRRASVRLLATATTDSKVPVDLPKLRRDLHTRLSRGRITLPALAQRREDIPELLERLGRDTAARLMLAWPGMTDDAVGAAMLKSWKGNVAELANAIERAMQRTGGRTPIDKESLFGPPPEAPGVALVDAWLHKDIPIMLWTDAKDSLHRAYLLRVLIAHDLSRAETARVLDVGTPHLQAMINRYGLRGELEILDAARARRLRAEEMPEA